MQNNIQLLFLTIFLFFTLSIQISSGQILINEVMPNNSSNSSGDWVELYNMDNFGVQLNNWYVQDFAGNKKQIENFYFNPISYKIIYFSNRLDNGGDTIYLFNDQNISQDSFTYSSSIPDFSFFRCPDGSSNWTNGIPTPGYANNCSQQINQTNSTNQTNLTSGLPGISFLYPSEIYNNKTNFTLSLSFENFSTGNYDIKIDIKNNNTYINRFWTNSGWSSKNSWIDGFVLISENPHKVSTINIIDVEDYFSGNATTQVKLRNSTSTYLSEIKQILILNGSQTTQNSSNSTNPTTESFIEILDYAENADFGDKINVDFHIYKGDTAKYAAYIYVQNADEKKVSEKITVHAGNSSSSSKFKDYYFEEKVLLDCLNDSGKYELVIEGLDHIETRDIKLDKCANAEGDTSSLKTEYIIENPEVVRVGEKIITPVKIINNENFEKTFLIWSYVYNGPKCYSCIDNREENSQQITVIPFSQEIIYLENTLVSAAEGNYSLKIKILRDGLKTPKEFTYPIIVQNTPMNQQSADYEEKTTGSILNPIPISNNISKSKKSIFLEATPYLVATISMLFCIYLVLKKI